MTTSLPDAPEEYANIYEAIGYFVFDFQVLLSTICFQILRLAKHSKKCEKILMQEFDKRRNHSNPLNYSDSLAINDVNGEMPAAIMVQL
ncbi:MAG: hypothetical protein QG650_323 [Patescibacteria group bacterium]|nr:hypothetical protein [Patescibacteria group bacterium]